MPAVARHVALAAVLGAGLPARSASQVTALRPLAFGTVVAGVPTAVAPTDAGAAAWRIRGVLGVTSSVTLTLPAVLTRVGGGATMPVSFCGTCAVYRVNNASPAGGTTFRPQTGPTGLVVAVLSDVYVWLGGTVSPAAGQAPGSYTGSVVLTVAALL